MAGIIKFHVLQSFTLTRRTELKAFINKLFKKEGKRLANLDYIFCSDEYLLKINQDFLKHDYYTDIITFDLSEPRQAITGEIYISVDRVKDNAFQQKTSFKEELHRVIFHGALHLCGYKDKTKTSKAEMTKKEDYYLSRF